MTEMTKDDFNFVLLEMYDLRNVLPAKVKAMKANDEGTDYTVGDLIDAVIGKIEAYDEE